MYLHLHHPLRVRRLLLPGLQALPKRATLLNDGRQIRCSTDLLPWRHKTGERPLRLCDLPTNAYAGSVMVLRLDFAPGILPP